MAKNFEKRKEIMRIVTLCICIFMTVSTYSIGPYENNSNNYSNNNSVIMNNGDEPSPHKMEAIANEAQQVCQFIHNSNTEDHSDVSNRVIGFDDCGTLYEELLPQNVSGKTLSDVQKRMAIEWINNRKRCDLREVLQRNDIVCFNYGSYQKVIRKDGECAYTCNLCPQSCARVTHSLQDMSHHFSWQHCGDKLNSCNRKS